MLLLNVPLASKKDPDTCYSSKRLDSRLLVTGYTGLHSLFLFILNGTKIYLVYGFIFPAYRASANISIQGLSNILFTKITSHNCTKQRDPLKRKRKRKRTTVDDHRIYWFHSITYYPQSLLTWENDRIVF
jgi:hypothetical protein